MGMMSGRSSEGFHLVAGCGTLNLMGELLPLPRVGDVFDDARGGDRTMRVSHHQERGILVISIWSGGTCRASFQVAADEVPRLALLLGYAAAEKPLPLDGEPIAKSA